MRNKKINLIILIIIFFYSIIKADNRCLNIIVKMNDKLSTDYTLVSMDSSSVFYEMPSKDSIKVGEYYINKEDVDKIFTSVIFIKTKCNKNEKDSIMVRLPCWRSIKKSNLCCFINTKKSRDYEYKDLSRVKKKDYLYDFSVYSKDGQFKGHRYKTNLFELDKNDYIPTEWDSIPPISERWIDVTEKYRLNLTVFVNGFCSQDYLLYRKNNEGQVIDTIKYKYNVPGGYFLSEEDYDNIVTNPYDLYLYVKYNHVLPEPIDINKFPSKYNKKKDFVEIPIFSEELLKDYNFWNIYTTDYEYSRKECRKNKKLIQSNPYSTSPFLILKE